MSEESVYLSLGVVGRSTMLCYEGVRSVINSWIVFVASLAWVVQQCDCVLLGVIYSNYRPRYEVGREATTQSHVNKYQPL